MMAKSTGIHACKKSLVVLLCLFLIGNFAHGTVLCFGADGHIEFESAFHKHCDDHDHEQSPDHGHQPFETDHEEGGCCGPCVDVPVTVDIVKTSRASNSFECAPAEAVAASEYLSPGEPGLQPSPHTFFLTEFCVPLRSVILLI